MTTASIFQSLLLHKKMDDAHKEQINLSSSLIFHPVYHISAISTSITGVVNPTDHSSDAPEVNVFVFVCVCVCVSV